ncbi:MAG: hypothetical protein EOO53_13430 [Gammaproteobacteria bacterium]|nr:MAG: hypothetical protein EOO53_13430 [Gammaproteobacteria bacterium]
MKINKLTNPQKIVAIIALAMAAAVSFLISLPPINAPVSMTNSEKKIVTREVELQVNATEVRDHISAPIQTKTATVAVAAKLPAITSWQMGGVKASVPAIPLNERISAYAVVELDQHPANLPAAGQQILLPMLNGQKIIANVESVNTNPNGDYSWSGHVDGYGTDYPVVMTYGEHSIFATITTPDGSYSMESLDGVGWLYKNPAEVELSTPGTKDYLEVNAIQ